MIINGEKWGKTVRMGDKLNTFKTLRQAFIFSDLLLFFYFFNPIK